MNPIFFCPSPGVTLARKLSTLAPLLLVIGLSGGCLSRPALVKQSFAFPIPPLAAHHSSEGPVLDIRDLRIAAPFDGESFVYRTGRDSYERDPYAEFLVAPAESLLPALREDFRNTGLFSDVLARGGVLKADMVLEVYVSQLYGDFTQRAAPKAVLRMSFTFIEPKQGSSGEPLLRSDYEQRVPVKARTAPALMSGWDDALKRIMAAVAVDLRKAQNR